MVKTISLPRGQTMHLAFKILFPLQHSLQSLTDSDETSFGWSCPFNKNCPISWSKPFHCLGDKQCISHSKFCSHFNIPFNPEPIATKLASDGPVPLFDFSVKENIESSGDLVDEIGIENGPHPLLGNFLNDQGRFFCPFPTCSCAVSSPTSKGWANTSSVLNHLKSQHKNESNCLNLHIFDS